MKECVLNVNSLKDLEHLYNKFNGYGYQPEQPIGIATPLEVAQFFKKYEICRDNSSDYICLRYSRVGSLTSTIYTGPVDKYKISYFYIKNGKPLIEVFEMYFCIYPKANQSWFDYIKSTCIGEQILPEGFVKRKPETNA